jgi:type I restriction enzyme R subunit
MVDTYNDGSTNIEEFFKKLLEFSDALTEEEARNLSEALTEEQLAVFDLLMRPAPDLSDAEEEQVKRVAEELLGVLTRDKLVLDWRKEQGTRAAVRVTVEEILDRLPEKYDQPTYAQKCDAVYQHIFDSYWDDGHSVYDHAA